MKNIKISNFLKKIKKTKLVGSVIGSAIFVFTASGCNFSEKQHNSEAIAPSFSDESFETPEHSTTEITETTPYFDSTTPTEIIVPSKPESETIITTTETSINTSKIETTQSEIKPETTIIPVPETETTTTFSTSPVTVMTTSTYITSTTKPKTEKTTTISTTTTPSIEEPISRLSEVHEYYDFYNVDTSKAKFLNKKNINNYDSFLSAFVNFFNESAIKNTIYFYTTAYNINTNSYDFCLSSGKLEKLAFLTLLNYNDIDDQTLKSIFKIYSEDELSGIISNIGIVFQDDLDHKSYYDYSKIVVNEEVRNVLIDAHNAYVANDGKKMGEICNKNFNKYNGLVDALLLIYKFNTQNVVGFEFNGTPSELFINLQENMGVYDRVHPKTLVLE